MIRTQAIKKIFATTLQILLRDPKQAKFSKLAKSIYDRYIKHRQLEISYCNLPIYKIA